jgi:ubiquinone/menaquinone biosynthesis C-methylase UbiE
MATPINLPPVHNKLAKHGVFPTFDHDETARYNFLTNLNKHLSTVFSPGNKVVFDNRIKPNFMAEHGRDFENRAELEAAMLADPHFQTWSALRRSTMEMRQQAGRATVLRQADDLAQKVAQLNAQSPETLILNDSVQVPHYMSMFDSHIMPGSYHTEHFEGDVSNAASYDSGLFVTSAGMLGKYTDGGGKALTTWLKATYPDFKPKRILDMGCGLGHNTLPLALTFPDAEVVGIDTGVPMLRYGHARAVSLGIKNVTFIQADATQTGFETDSFDWIQTTMFLHETSVKAMEKLITEIYRMLRPNGLSLHIEQPQYTPQMSMFEQYIRDWDALYNNEPFWGAMHDVDVRTWIMSAGFKEANLLQFGAKAENDMEYPKNPDAVEAEDHGRSPIWNVFGAWK